MTENNLNILQLALKHGFSPAEMCVATDGKNAMMKTYFSSAYQGKKDMDVLRYADAKWNISGLFSHDAIILKFWDILSKCNVFPICGVHGLVPCKWNSGRTVVRHSDKYIEECIDKYPYIVGDITDSKFVLMTAEDDGLYSYTVTLPADVDISGLMSKITGGTVGNVVTVAADGETADGGVALANIKKGKLAAMCSGTWDAAAVKEALGDNFGAAQLPTITIKTGAALCSMWGCIPYKRKE